MLFARGLFLFAIISLAGCATSTSKVSTLPALSRNVFAERISTSRTRGHALELQTKQALVRHALSA